MRKNTVLALLLVVVAAFSLGGCGGSSDNKAPSSALSGWQGEWKSQSFCLESPEMKPAYQAVADKMGGVVNADDVHEAMKAMLQTSVASVTVSGDSITFTNADGTAKTCAYRHVRDIPMPGFEGNSWKAFEVSSPDSPYRYVVFTEVHSDSPDSMKHWHFRYGPMGFDALVNHPNTMWWPTLVAADTTVGVVAQDTIGAAGEMAGFFKMLPSLEKWKGTWKSCTTFLDDPKMDEAYKAVASKAAGYTVEEIKQVFKKLYDSRGIVSLEIDAKNITLRKEGSSVSMAYDSHLISPMIGFDGWSWSRFATAEGDPLSPAYRYLIASAVHQDKPGAMVHWHLRFGGEGFSPLVQMEEPWYPTFVAEETTVEKFAGDMLEAADEMAQMLPRK